MNDPSDKIVVPEDLAQDPETDPEILAEERKLKIWHLRLERYKEVAAAISVMLQTFKAEAVSLVSGIGTLVAGWFQIRKWVAQGRADSRNQGRVEGAVIGRSEERLDRRDDGRAAKGLSVKTEVSEIKKLEPSVMMAGQTITATVELPGVSQTAIDPMNYVSAGLLAVFVWSSVVAWVKRRHKALQNKGGPNGTV